MHFYGSASAEPFFVAPFPENWGARLRISGGCPARGEPEALVDFCSSIACRAQPCQRCSPVLQALIIFQMQLYGSASAEPFFVLRRNPPQKGAFPLFLRGRLCYTIIALVRAARAANRCVLPKVAYPGQGARKRLSFEKRIKRSFIMLTAITGINSGDEGKGRMVDLISQEYDIVARYQGCLLYTSRCV